MYLMVSSVRFASAEPEHAKAGRSMSRLNDGTKVCDYRALYINGRCHRITLKGENHGCFRILEVDS